MLAELFEKQKGYLNDFFEKVDIDVAESITKDLQECCGSLIFTGVGKSGHIAEKIATTFSSTGTKAHFLSTQNALHGDIGIVHPEDIVIFLSKSGETEELLKLLPFVHLRGAKTQAWVCKNGSSLGGKARKEIVLPIQEELCPFKLAPTTSAAVQLIFGDIMAVSVMQERGFTLDDYFLNHPLGQIGKRIEMKVSDLMLKEDRLPTCRKSDLLSDVLYELTSKRCGCVLIVDEKEKIEGIFTDGDLRRALQEEGQSVMQKTMETLMNPTFISANETDRIELAKQKMQENPERRVMMLPITAEDRLVGLLHMHDIVQTGI
ncbi:MAG: KpsF/GutQ family sugar-phosphate isomerase [Simkaniaceae bacterium]|nr:KpsF/GutQ family sugar-phosphate isomerase [Simkaniaceae bacterium]